MLAFFGGLDLGVTRSALKTLQAARGLFDDRHAAFFGVSVDPRDESDAFMAGYLPGMRCFRDFDQRVSRLYGIVGKDEGYRPTVFLLDPLLRVVGYRPVEAIESLLDELQLRLKPSGGEEARHAPVLTAPRVFEAAFCRALIAHYESEGGASSGVMRKDGDRTVLVHDSTFKRRSDVEIKDEALKAAVRERLRSRLGPLVERAYSWRPTRLERYLIACYDAKDGGFFQPHRDNTTPGTAHRRLAVTINLNTGDYEGGSLAFPEFGSALFRPPTGGALVFGCGLLHEVRPVTRGRRYAFLPFLYDEEAAAVRDRNRASLA